MSWLPAMMFMHMLDDDELDQPKRRFADDYKAGHDLHRQGSACRERDHGNRHDACCLQPDTINLNHNTEQKKKETTTWEYSACSPSSE